METNDDVTLTTGTHLITLSRRTLLFCSRSVAPVYEIIAKQILNIHVTDEWKHALIVIFFYFYRRVS